MGLTDWLGFRRKEKNVEESIYDVEPPALRAQVDKVYNRIKSAREQKNKLPAGKTLLNRLELVEKKEPETYTLMVNVVLPELSNLSEDIKTLLARINDTKTDIVVPDKILEFLNSARIEFDQDARFAKDFSKPKSERKMKRIA